MKKLSLVIILFCCFSCSTFAQWQQCEGTSVLNMQSLLTSGNYNFAGGSTGVYLSTNSAANYVSSNSGNDNVGPTRGFAKDNNNIYTCTSKGVFRSSDNGATWVSKSLGLTNLLTSGIINVGSKLFVVGPTGVFMSSDNAENWSSAGLTTTDVRSIAAINDTLFVGTNGAGIYKSVNWGSSWVAVNNGLGGATNFRAIESKGNTLFAGGQIGTGVFRSTDFGTNWTLLSGGLPSGSFRGFASNNKFIFAGSFGGGVFYSTDNGNNWTGINSGLTDLTIFDLELNENYIIAATNTQGVFRFALSNINLNTGVANNLNNSNVELYPNPTKNQINVKLDATYFGSDFKIYNITGEVVLSGKVTSENTVIGLNSLPIGMYFFSVGDNFKKTFKVIKK